MTGTILSGSISLGDSVEIPALKVSLTLSFLLPSLSSGKEAQGIALLSSAAKHAGPAPWDWPAGSALLHLLFCPALVLEL